MTSSPIMSLGISVSPELSSWRTIELITRSIRSGSTGRFLSEMRIERASLSRSKGSRCAFFFTTVNSRSCTRSKVVKRAAQFGHCRRRRIAPRSSVGRESLTWVSSQPQNGQRMFLLPFGPRSARIDRETGTERRHLAPHRRFDRAIVLAIGGNPVEHLGDHLADLPELGLAEAARRRRRAAKPDTRRHHRLFRIEGDAVLVARDAGALEGLLGDPAGQALRPEIDKHQV